jgi:hypothetical protein
MRLQAEVSQIDKAVPAEIPEVVAASRLKERIRKTRKVQPRGRSVRGQEADLFLSEGLASPIKYGSGRRLDHGNIRLRIVGSLRSG